MRVSDVINRQCINVVKSECPFCKCIVERHYRYHRLIKETQCSCGRWLEWIKCIFLAGILIVLVCIAGGWQPFASAQYHVLQKQIIAEINRKADEDQRKLMQNWRSQ